MESMSTSRPTTWLVTGASRGIGFEIVRQLVESSSNLVIAGCRTPDKATALDALKRTSKGSLHIIKLDVDDFDGVRASAKDLEAILGDLGLDYLINNAGIGSHDAPFNIDPEELLSVLRTNTVGPALVSQIALPFLEKGLAKKILHISSTSGSIASVATVVGPKITSYSMSKAALNMLAYKQKLERPDLIIIPLCPWYVKTDMSDHTGLLEPHESVAGILKVITTATAADSGRFLRHDGEPIPW